MWPSKSQQKEALPCPLRPQQFGSTFYIWASTFLVQSSSLSKWSKKFQRILKVWDSKFQYYLIKKRKTNCHLSDIVQMLKKNAYNERQDGAQGKGILYLSSISMGQNGASSLHWFYYLNTCWTSQSECNSRVKWRHDETWTIYDCDLFVQGDNLHVPETRKMVTDGHWFSWRSRDTTKLRVGLNKLSTVCQIHFIIICFMFI